MRHRRHRRDMTVRSDRVIVKRLCAGTSRWPFSVASIASIASAGSLERLASRFRGGLSSRRGNLRRTSTDS